MKLKILFLFSFVHFINAKSQGKMLLGQTVYTVISKNQTCIIKEKTDSSILMECDRITKYYAFNKLGLCNYAVYTYAYSASLQTSLIKTMDGSYTPFGKDVFKCRLKNDLVTSVWLGNDGEFFEMFLGDINCVDGFITILATQ